MQTPSHDDRAHALLSASSASRWMHCTPSARIEESIPDTRDSQYAAEGTLAHEAAEIALRVYIDKDIKPRGRAARIKAQCAKVDGIDDDMIGHAREYAAYVTGIADTLEGATVMVEQRVDYSAYAPSGFGTADAIIVHDHGIAVVDYKYGKGVKVEAEGNPQMKLYALGALLMLEDVYDLAPGDELRMVIYQPRLDHISEASMSIHELEGWAMTDVQAAADMAFAGEGNLIAGDWCRFCRAAGQCTELANYSTELAGEDFDSESWAMTDEQMNEALRRIPSIKAWLNAVEAAAINALLDGDRDLPDFKVVEGRSIRKLDDPEAVYAAMVAEGFDESMLYERKMLTLAQLEKLAGKKKFAEIAQGHIIKPAGKPTLAAATDRRESISASDDFDVE